MINAINDDFCPLDCITIAPLVILILFVVTLLIEQVCAENDA